MCRSHRTCDSNSDLLNLPVRNSKTLRRRQQSAGTTAGSNKKHLSNTNKKERTVGVADGLCVFVSTALKITKDCNLVEAIISGMCVQ